MEESLKQEENLDSTVMGPRAERVFQDGVDDQLTQMILSQINANRELITGFSKVEIASDLDRRVLVDLYFPC